MNTYLLRKEISGLKIILWLAIAIWALEFGYIFITDFPDILTEADRADALSDRLENTMFDLLLFGMLIGASLFGQEREHKTIPFLDGLPVRRSTLFFHKFIAACAAIFLIGVGRQSIDTFLDWLASDSLTQGPSWKSLMAESGVQFLLGYAIVGVATLVSFSRKWFPLFAGLIILSIVLVQSAGTSLSPWVDSPVMLRWAMSDVASSFPWRPAIGIVLIGAVGWMAALVGFQYRDGYLSRQLEKASQWRLASWAVAFSQLIAAGVWITALTSVFGDSETPTVESLAAGSIEPSQDPRGAAELVGFVREETQHYEVVFRESQREQVARFVGWLDTLHDDVSKFFDEPPKLKAKIVLDSASPVVVHAAGQTNWTKIRIPASLVRDELEFCRTVRHETGHVYIGQLSGGRVYDEQNAMRMFNEGLASLCELADDLQGDTPARLAKERWAAGVDSRGRVPLHILCDDNRLGTMRDPIVVYPLGFVVAEAMIDAGGPSLPRKFLTALKDVTIPPGVKPSEVWRIVLQKCDTSLDRVIAHYEARLDSLAEREKDFVESLPRLTPSASVESSDIVIRVTPPVTDPERAIPICLVERSRVMTADPENVVMTGPGEFRMPRSSVAGNKIRVLVGWGSVLSENRICEPWVELDLKD